MLHSAFWRGEFDLVMKLIRKGGDPFQENKKSESIFSELKMCSFDAMKSQLVDRKEEVFKIFQEKKTEAANCILDYELVVEKCEEENGRRLVKGSVTIWKNRNKKMFSHQLKGQVKKLFVKKQMVK